MSIQYENAGSVTTLLDAGLNSLADDAGALSSAFDNTSGLYLWALFELYIDSFGSAPTAGELVNIYFADSIDGSNYADGAAGSPASDLNGSHFVFAFSVRNEAGAQRIMIPNPIVIPPVKFKVLLVNKTGQTFAASGNTLKILPTRLQ